MIGLQGYGSSSEEEDEEGGNAVLGKREGPSTVTEKEVGKKAKGNDCPLPAPQLPTAAYLFGKRDNPIALLPMKMLPSAASMLGASGSGPQHVASSTSINSKKTSNLHNSQVVHSKDISKASSPRSNIPVTIFKPPQLSRPNVITEDFRTW